MFTGLVADLGTLEAIEQGPDGARLRSGTALADGLGNGDSVAVNGVCLTVTEHDSSGFAADAQGGLEIDGRAGLEVAERGQREGLVHRVGGKASLVVLGDGQADAVDRDRVAPAESRRQRRGDPQPGAVRALLDRLQGAEVGYEAREHSGPPFSSCRCIALTTLAASP